MIENILLLILSICAVMTLLMRGKLVEVAIVTITHYFPRSKFAHWAEARDYDH
jgi:hypothetical protein